MKTFVSYFLYPLLLASTLVLFVAALGYQWDLKTVFAWMAGGRIAVLFAVEFLYPAKAQWKMTWSSFKRDLKYVAVNGSVVGALKLASVWLALDLSRFNTGIVSGTSIVVEVVAIILTFEFVQYWYHRLSHEGGGPLGAWLWRVHVAHHLPDRVYLLMHAVGHPLDLLRALAITQLPLIILGARPESIFLYNALMGLQGLVSHFNVDVKAGPLNYVLTGTELHRLHHSADTHEAKNYGVLTPFWDIVFGTFVYKPHSLPLALGVDAPDDYPPSDDIRGVLALPFAGPVLHSTVAQRVR